MISISRSELNIPFPINRRKKGYQLPRATLCSARLKRVHHYLNMTKEIQFVAYKLLKHNFNWLLLITVRAWYKNDKHCNSMRCQCILRKSTFYWILIAFDYTFFHFNCQMTMWHGRWSQWCTLLIALNSHNRYVCWCESCLYRYLHHGWHTMS